MSSLNIQHYKSDKIYPLNHAPKLSYISMFILDDVDNFVLESNNFRKVNHLPYSVKLEGKIYNIYSNKKNRVEEIIKRTLHSLSKHSTYNSFQNLFLSIKENQESYVLRKRFILEKLSK